LAFNKQHNAMKYNRIKAILAEKGMTNKHLASLLSIHEQSVSRWATNSRQPDLATLYKIAEILNVDVCDLLNKNPD